MFIIVLPCSYKFPKYESLNLQESWQRAVLIQMSRTIKLFKIVTYVLISFSCSSVAFCEAQEKDKLNSSVSALWYIAQLKGLPIGIEEIEAFLPQKAIACEMDDLSQAAGEASRAL